ncbi:hypothetical protein ACFOZ0_35470, partial [Streptomyces yaanensis]
MLPQHDRIGFRSGCRDDVGDQTLVPAHILPRDHGRLRDLRVLGDDRLDLARLDPETTDLHLLISPAQIHQVAIGVPAHHIPGPVQTPTTTGSGVERVGD